MTTYNKATLKTFFETGDVPTGTDYANFIDSYVNLVETAEQAMAGPLNTTELITPNVSATNIVTDTVSATNIYASNASFFSITTQGTIDVGNSVNIVNSLTVSGNAIFALNLSVSSNINASTASITNKISAASINLSGDVSAATGTVYASAVRSTNGMIAGVGIVSAAGTTQGTAAALTNVVNRGKGIADGSTTGFALLANRAGLVQYLFNEGASANLWPPTGGIINGLAANAAFPLTASAMVTIVHLTASAYAVK